MRRADVVSTFSDEASSTWFVALVLFEENDECQLQRRYMTLKIMAGGADGWVTLSHIGP